MIGQTCKSSLFWFGLAYLVFGVLGFTSIRWVHALPDLSALAPISGTITRITTCGNSAYGRFAAIDLTTAAGTATRVLVPKIEFLECPGARQRLARLKVGDQVTAWVGRYPTDEEQGQFVWALKGPTQTIISLEEMQAAHLKHFRDFRLYSGIVPTLGALMILFTLNAAYRTQRRTPQSAPDPYRPRSA
jgi:hypothetical protein